MLIKGLLAAEMSGKAGGIVASHNRGGQYFRQFRVPVNPATSQQQAIRNAFGSLAAHWTETLTQTQRDDWDAYASVIGSTNAMGDFINPGGKALYQGWNSVRLVNALPRVDDVPTFFERPSLNEPTIDSWDLVAQTVDLDFSTSNPFVDEDDAALLVYISPPRSAGTNFFKGPYRLATAILGDSTTPPTSPATIALPFTVAAGQRVFFKANVTRADGRYSFPIRFRGDAS